MAALLAGALALWAGLAGLAHAAPGDRATRSALIIAIANYGPENIPALDGVPFDVNSARSIAQAMGIPDQRITVLRDAQATKDGILRALENLGRTVGEGSRVLVYFSGHGTRWLEQGAGCKEGLLAYDGKTLTNEEIAQRTRRMSELADKVIVMFDACHSEGVTRRGATTRSIAQGKLTPKFFLKAGAGEDACAANNVQTRSLLAASTRLGALSENFVQITSSRANEVSYDEPGKGGMATQGVRDCLLGRARDRDASGAVSMAEIEQCAQGFIDEKFKAEPHLRHHVSVTGNRNLVPVSTVRPPAPAPAAPVVVAAAPPQPTPPAMTVAAPPAVAPTPAPLPAPLPAPVATPAPAPAPAPVAAPAPVRPPAPTLTPPVAAPTPPAPAQPVRPPQTVAIAPPQTVTIAPPQAVTITPPQAVTIAPPSPVMPAAPVAPAAPAPAPSLPALAEPPAPPVEPAIASLATLKEIEAQRNPKRRVDVTLDKTELRIGKDPLNLKIRSARDGYVYLVLLGSDRKSFYILFPNGLDRDNAIRANVPMTLPRPDWQVVAQGPAGMDHMLVVVSDTPRALSALTLSPPDAKAPFTFALNDLPGRAALFDFFSGGGVTGSSESFGAKLITIKEVR
jgi:hypothetical protein